MTSFVLKFLTASAVVVTSLGTLSTSVAQPVYRIVSPDGKVTFSDRPPPSTGRAKVSAGSTASGGDVATISLPFALRQVASKYPVTLYTSENCGPCGSARSLLVSRGVPFIEKIVSTPDDATALQSLSGDNSLPFGTIGSQQLKGFSDIEWTQFLNAAGYPEKSVLPSSYRQPPATPLVVIAATPSATTTAAAKPAPARAAPAPIQPAPTADNRSGIRF